jgi:hypothetical protein
MGGTAAFIIEANIRAAVGVNNPTAMAEDEAEIDA